FFFFQAEDGIRDFHVTGVQTCALPISKERMPCWASISASTAPPPPAPTIATSVSIIACAMAFRLLRPHDKSFVIVPQGQELVPRSEERRVGKECSSRWTMYP